MGNSSSASFFSTNNFGAPHGVTLGLINYLSNNVIYFYSSTNFVKAI